MSCHTWLLALTWVLDSKLSSSHPHSKHCTHWAASPEPSCSIFLLNILFWNNSQITGSCREVLTCRLPGLLMILPLNQNQETARWCSTGFSILLMHVCVCMCGISHVEAKGQFVGSHFFPSTMRVQLRYSGSVVSTFSYWAISHVSSTCTLVCVCGCVRVCVSRLPIREPCRAVTTTKVLCCTVTSGLCCHSNSDALLLSPSSLNSFCYRTLAFLSVGIMCYLYSFLSHRLISFGFTQAGVLPAIHCILSLSASVWWGCNITNMSLATFGELPACWVLCVILIRIFMYKKEASFLVINAQARNWGFICWTWF